MALPPTAHEARARLLASLGRVWFPQWGGLCVGDATEFLLMIFEFLNRSRRVDGFDRCAAARYIERVDPEIYAIF